MSETIIIGYSGHAYVVIDALQSNGTLVGAYLENEEKKENPFKLTYLGKENSESGLEKLRISNWFIAIGSNRIRAKIYQNLIDQGIPPPLNAIHQKSKIAQQVKLGKGILIAMGCCINPLAQIGDGVICNTGSIIEHECRIEDFAHIAPGAVLAGNVHVGKETFIGANAVVKQGVIIGKGVTIGAGSVIIKDVPDGVTIVGNPGKIIR